MKKLEIIGAQWKLIVLSVFALGVFTLSSCNKDDEEPEPTETTGEIIAGDDDLSEFTGYVTANEELNGYLTGEANYTVFAPQDAAFDRLRTVLGIEDLAAISPAVIGQVLKFHFVAGTKLSSELLGGSATTAQGAGITITADGFINEAGSDTDGSEILVADLKATNGVVHKVETILIPEALFAEIGSNLATMAQPLLLGAPFTDLLTVIAKADESVPEGKVAFSAIFKDRTKTLTAFLPTNDVFTGVAANQQITKDQLLGSIKASAASARTFLENNISSTAIKKGSDLEHGGSITMMSGLSVTTNNVGVSESVPSGWVLTVGETNLPIYSLDAFKGSIPDETNPGQYLQLPSAQNGALHVSVPIIISQEAK